MCVHGHYVYVRVLMTWKHGNRRVWRCLLECQRRMMSWLTLCQEPFMIWRLELSLRLLKRLVGLRVHCVFDEVSIEWFSMWKRHWETERNRWNESMPWRKSRPKRRWISWMRLWSPFEERRWNGMVRRSGFHWANEMENERTTWKVWWSWRPFMEICRGRGRPNEFKSLCRCNAWWKTHVLLCMKVFLLLPISLSFSLLVPMS